MIQALLVLDATATVLAWALAQRRPDHRPIAYLLTAGLVLSALRRALWFGYLSGVAERSKGPWTGLPLIVAHLDDALFIAWPAMLAGVAVHVFLKRSAWPVAFAYMSAVLALVIVHPKSSTGALPRALLAAQLAGLAVAFGSGIAWYRSATERANTAQAMMVLITAGELALLVGAWRVGVYNNWDLSQLAYLVVFAVLSLLQGGLLWKSS